MTDHNRPHEQASAWGHIQEFADGVRRFSLGWCPECQQWKERDHYIPNAQRTYRQLSVPVPDGFHFGLLAEQPLPTKGTNE